MRHGDKINNLGRKTSHRKALLSNMASSLILNKRITTTVAKAKELRKYVEPLITRAKDDTTHSRRMVFSYLQNKESVKALFGEVASKTSERPGGYTRIIKLADVRQGDNAEMCLIELVDFNMIYGQEGAEKKGKTRRGRKPAKKTDASAETATVEASAEEKKPAKIKKATKSKE
ncbi:MAG: 50S ribosomal protein L17 [Flammeovirgaceae bacterium]|nr:50S ribosomal protein L17 [Flammeovirgaceae bacterium]